MPVGWNCTNSMSCSGTPARKAMALPSPVQVCAEVAEKYAREREGLGNAGPAFEWKPEPLPQQVQSLLRDLDGFWAAPGGQQKEKLAELPPLVSDASAQVKKIAEEDLPALNKKMNDAGIPHIIPAPPERPGRGGDADEDEP